jgi:hypothetical protein
MPQELDEAVLLHLAWRPQDALRALLADERNREAMRAVLAPDETQAAPHPPAEAKRTRDVVAVDAFTKRLARLVKDRLEAIVGFRGLSVPVSLLLLVRVSPIPHSPITRPRLPAGACRRTRSCIT